VSGFGFRVNSVTELVEVSGSGFRVNSVTELVEVSGSGFRVNSVTELVEVSGSGFWQSGSGNANFCLPLIRPEKNNFVETR